MLASATKNLEADHVIAEAMAMAKIRFFIAFYSQIMRE